MKHICDGHEYTTQQDGGTIHARNNYGTPVAISELSPCMEYVIFTSFETGHSDAYHVNAIGDRYSVAQQLVRWYSVSE